MNKPMAIIQSSIHFPNNIKHWAEEHSVPILGPDNDLDYDYIIEYSEDITEDYLEIAYCHSHNIPATIGTTEHLILREIGLDDLDIYQDIINKYPEAVSDQGLIGLSKAEFTERHSAYIKYSYHFLGYGIWGIFLKSDFTDRTSCNMIGIAGIDGVEVPALSYALYDKYRGKGYALEAVLKVMEYAAHILELDRIKLNVKENNIPSIKLAHKIRNIYPKILEINIL